MSVPELITCHSKNLLDQNAVLPGDLIYCYDTKDFWITRKHCNSIEFVLYESPIFETEAVGWVDAEEKILPTNCPNCGAPTNPHAQKCAYCDTYYSL